MSYAGLGQTSTAMMPAATVGRSASRHEAGGAVRVPATWAQRAANAGNRYNRSSAPLIGVDGHAGPITIGALRTLSHQFSSDQPVTNNPPTSRVTDTVIIPVALETALAARNFVADPPLSTATHRTATTSTGVSVPAPIPGAVPAETPADTVILDEGSSSGAGGLIARFGIWPWAIAGTALVGVGLWFMMGSGAGASVRANRRRVRRNSKRKSSRRKRVVYYVGKGESLIPGPYTSLAGARERASELASHGLNATIRRVRRNSKHKIRRSSVPWNYPCPGCGATELGKFGHGAGCKLAHHRLAGTFSVPKRKKSVRRNSGSWIVAIGNRGEYLKSYDYSPTSGVGDYAVTKSQRDAMGFTSEKAKSVARSISSDGGPSTRAVRPGEGVRRNYSYEHTSHPYKYDTGRVRRNAADWERVTNAQIEAYRWDAFVHGDEATVALADIALGGKPLSSESAREALRTALGYGSPTRMRRKISLEILGGMSANRRRVRRNSARSLSEIAAEIRRDWKNPYFGAVPYLQAMGTLDSVRDSYGADRGDSIVAYFLGNATAWRGPTAKRIKAELNAALKERRR
jgi:hypothetical protein